MKTQLLCTFAETDNLQDILQKVRENYKIVYNYIYILQNKTNIEELYITYNIDVEFRPPIQLENTILVHRKKQSNTLYTINALNALIASKNGGKIDKSYKIDWDELKNSILVTAHGQIKIVKTKIKEILNF